ncbi:hypothetical protein BDD12DRAFT_877794 [Trichophaea hybrida]|nr:hypothetical protein BDD12DRAFT_877794 [Trichophaea hybrida]
MAVSSLILGQNVDINADYLRQLMERLRQKPRANATDSSRSPFKLNSKLQHPAHLLRKLFRLDAPVHAPGNHPPGASASSNGTSAPIDPGVLEGHPLELEWVFEVLPQLKKLMDQNLNPEETFTVEVWPGTTPEKLTVRIRFRDPSKIQRVVDGSPRCLDKQKYDVIYAEGDDLRQLARFGENRGPDTNSLSIPNLPGYASGMPIYSTRNGNQLQSALMGGMVRIDHQLLGIASFHFLTPKPTTDNPPIDISSEASNMDSIVSANHESTAENQSSTPRPFWVGELSGTDAFLQPWPWRELERTDGIESPIKMQIHSASGTRLSTSAFEWHGETAGDLRCIMDWALFHLAPVPYKPNYYFKIDNNSETVRMIHFASTTTVTPPGGRLVDIVVRGRVYCTGRTSALPCLLSSQGGSGLAFVVSTNRRLEEGLSGAWLVDSNSTELVGHLFAASVSSPLGYFVPIMETLRDIQTVLGTDEVQLVPDDVPQLPTSADRAHLRPSAPVSQAFNLTELSPIGQTNPQLTPLNLISSPLSDPIDLESVFYPIQTSSIPSGIEDSPHSRPSRPQLRTVPNLGLGLVLFLKVCLGFGWMEEQMVYSWDPLYGEALQLNRRRDHPRSESGPTDMESWPGGREQLSAPTEGRSEWAGESTRSTWSLPLTNSGIELESINLESTSQNPTADVADNTRRELTVMGLQHQNFYRLRNIPHNMFTTKVILLQLAIKLVFEGVAGALTAAAVTSMLHLRTDTNALLLGLYCGLLRSCIVDLLPPIACIVWTDIIQSLFTMTYGVFATVPFIISCLCVYFHLMFVFGSLFQVPWVANTMFAGIPASYITTIQVRGFRKVSQNSKLRQHWTLASAWATHNMEFGYIVGEALSGVLLVLPITRNAADGGYGALAGSLYGLIVLLKVLCCALVMQLYEYRGWIKTESGRTFQIREALLPVSFLRRIHEDTTRPRSW